MERGRENEGEARKKIALYEMFSISSHEFQSFNRGCASRKTSNSCKSHCSINKNDAEALDDVSERSALDINFFKGKSAVASSSENYCLVNRGEAIIPSNLKITEERVSAAEVAETLENHISRETISEKGKISKAGSGQQEVCSLGSEICSGHLLKEEENNLGRSIVEDPVRKLNEPAAGIEAETSSDVSPDDVVGLIGVKYFWKLRRAIANQQRIFSMQIFELHRLISVQKLLSGSPLVNLGEIPSSEGQLEALGEEPTDFISDQRDPSQPVSTECLQKPSSSNPWLIPDMSPTEELVYKRYPCSSSNSPPGELLTSIYDQAEVSKVEQQRQDSSSGCNWALTTSKPILQIESSLVPTSGENTSSNLHGRRVPFTPLPWISSSFVPTVASDRIGTTHRRLAWPLCKNGTHNSRNVPWISSLQGSAPPSQVVKAVPHDPELTTESATRIFQSIKRERQEYKWL